MSSKFTQSPTNGATVTVGKRKFTYDSTVGAWKRVGGTATVSATSNITVSNTVTTNTVDANAVTFADGTTQTTAGASTGKAIAMAMIFGG